MNGLLSFSDYNPNKQTRTLIKLWYDPQLGDENNDWIVALSTQEFEEVDDEDSKLTEKEESYKSIYFDIDDIVLLKNYCESIIEANRRAGLSS